MVVTFGDGELEDPSYQPLIESGLHSWFFRNNLAWGTEDERIFPKIFG